MHKREGVTKLERRTKQEAAIGGRRLTKARPPATPREWRKIRIKCYYILDRLFGIAQLGIRSFGNWLNWEFAPLGIAHMRIPPHK
uniref:Uncharacterized protein n=1 Tax=Romanomermis culicivorax TaxID=13658 RepID=A0A915JZ12_ROMCU